jgi:hypothetical protein
MRAVQVEVSALAMEPMLDQMIADESRALGAHHPRIAGYLSVRSSLRSG